MRDLFYELVDRAERLLEGDEVLLANFAAETSDFVRFNRARVRQAGSVRQAELELALVDRGRRAETTIALGGTLDIDFERIAASMRAMRDDFANLPADPYLLYSEAAVRAESVRRGRLPAAAEALEAILDAAGGSDFVGIFASGPIQRGFASSRGARLWHEVEAFQLDWSVYHAGDKAVKRSFAAADWDAAEIAARIEASRAELAHLEHRERVVPPGEYRAYLAPAAVDELIGMLNWDGVSARAQRTHESSLQHLVAGTASFAPSVSLTESLEEGLAPAFDHAGFMRPSSIALIRGGRHAGALVCARSEKEFGIPANGADGGESMQAAALAPGALAQADALAALDTGLYISNLWYLNFSDRPACRLTGMTRFASFWVENGRIVAPLAVARFDDSLYRLFGERLEALTREREWMLDTNTYGGRSVRTSRMPGALVAAMRFTL